LKQRQSIDPLFSDKVRGLANQIFIAFPQEVNGLKFYLQDCGCIYYRRVYPDRALETKIGIYRDAGDGACEVYIGQGRNWKDRVFFKPKSLD